MDEDFATKEVRERLDQRRVKYHLYSDYVPAHAGVHDTVVLGHVKHSWIYITGDYHQRYRKAEQQGLIRQGVKQFVLPGSINGREQADLLIRSKNKMFEYCREHDGPFSVSIDRRGKLTPKMDGHGIINSQKRPQKAEAAHAV